MHTPTEPDRPEPERKSGSSLVHLDLVRGSDVPLPIPGPDDIPTYIGPRRSSMAEALSLAPGYRLGHFEVIEAVGSGGMAAVLKARDTELGRLVALKILPPETTRDAENITRFKQEARAAARLDHENVARVFFCGEDRGLHFIAFEFVEGNNLRTQIDRQGTISPVDCIRYMLQISAGLAHAAERGVVHRDIKPSNIVITPDGRAKIIDMGLARHHDAQSVNGGVTHSGVTLGTFDYISPEQALDPRRADVRSDIYSLGCAFYHALTGRPPVPEGTAAMKLQAQQHDSPTDPRLLNPLVPDDLAAILSRMMAKKPERRYQTPAELIVDLHTLAAKLQPVNLDGGRSTSSMAIYTPTPNRRLSPGLVFGLAAIAVAIAITVSMTTGGHSTTDIQPWPNPPTIKPIAQIPDGSTTPRITPRSGAPVVVDTVEELTKALQSPNPSILLRGGKTYDLSADVGLLVNDQQDVVIECHTPETPATIRLAITEGPADQPGALRANTLTLAQIERVRLRGIRFEIVEGAPNLDSSVTPAALIFSDVNRLDIQECRFEVDASAPTATARAIGVNRVNRQSLTTVNVSNCYFNLRSWSGIDFLADAQTKITECGFATSRSAFAVLNETENSTAGTPTVSLDIRHSTFLLDHSAIAVDTSGMARCAVTSGYSVYAATAGLPAGAMMMEPKENKPAVIRKSESATFTTAVKEPNAYFRVDLPVPAGPNAIDLRQSPWANNPPTNKLVGSEPWKAFQLNTTHSALRDSDPSKVGLLGAQYLPVAGRRIYEQWPPPRLSADLPKAGVRVWWPNPPAADRENLPKHVYDLAAALAEMRSGEELQIRGNGPIEVPMLAALNRPNWRITIRAEGGSTPVLVPAASDRADVSLFRLEQGEIRFEGLEFLLRASGDEEGELRSMSVVTLAGGRRCLFANCVFTLDEQKTEKFSVVSILDVSGQMRKSDITRRPEMAMENCLVRGRGRVVRVPSGFPVEVHLSNTALALTGPVFDLGAPPKSPPSGAVVSVHLNHITSILDGSLFELASLTGSAEGSSSSLPVEVRADSCLFVPVNEEKPLIAIRPGETASVDKYLTWQMAGNGFANLKTDYVFLEITPEDGGRAKAFDQAAWLKLSEEKPSAIGKVTFQKPPAKGFADVQPDDLTLTTTEFGGGQRELGVNPAALRRPFEMDKIEKRPNR